MKRLLVAGIVGLAIACGGAECRCAAHPRLLADEAKFESVRKRLTASDVGQAALRVVLGEANRLVAHFEPVPYKLHGKRLATPTEFQEIVLTLAFAGRWTGERRYARAAIEHTLHACRVWPDFHPSHFLDTAIVGFGAAIVYDWCFGAMTDEERREIAEAIDVRTLKPALQKDKPWHVHFSRVSNWNQVCNGGMLACAAAIRETYPDDAEAIRCQALRGLPKALQVYAPCGCWPEGPGYWEFAMRYTAFAFESLRAGWGTTFGLDRLPGLREAVGYVDAMTGPSGRVFNYGDNAVERVPKLGVWFLASYYDRPEALVGFESRLFRESLAPSGKPPVALPLFLLYYRDVPRDASAPALCQVMTNATMGVVAQRTSWAPDAWYAALRAGSTQAGHSHLDIGSFVLDAYGTRWAHDLGGQKYVDVELAHLDLWNDSQEGDRWKLFRYSSEGHNTVTINGRPILVDRYASVTSFAPGFPSVATLDLSPVTADAPKALRTATMPAAGGWELSDSFAGVRPGKKLEWRMNTDAAVTVDGVVARLEKTVGGKPVTLTVTLSGVTAGWEVRDVSKPPHPCDKDNPGMRQLFFRTSVPASGAVDYVVRFAAVSSAWDRETVRRQADRAADWQIATPVTTGRFVHQHTPLYWTMGAFYNGLLDWGLANPGSRRFADHVRRIGEETGWDRQHLDHCVLGHADTHCVCSAWLQLAAEDNVLGERIRAAKDCFDELMADKRAYTLEFVRKDPLSKMRWTWADALYMSPPSWVLLAGLTGEGAYLDHMAREFKATTGKLFNEKARLYYRDSTYLPGGDNWKGRDVFWGRGNGWVFGALAMILRDLPSDHPSRGWFEDQFREMAKGVLAVQAADGSWHPDLADPKSPDCPEMSGTSFFTYGLVWGMNNGLLEPKAVEPAVRRAWEAICRATDASGRLGWVQQVGSSPTAELKSDYFEVYATGAYLCAAKELCTWIVRKGIVASETVVNEEPRYRPGKEVCIGRDKISPGDVVWDVRYGRSVDGVFGIDGDFTFKVNMLAGQRRTFWVLRQ